MKLVLHTGEMTGLNRSLVLGEQLMNQLGVKENFRHFRQQIQTRAIEFPDSSVELELSDNECRTIFNTLEKVCGHRSEDFDPDFLVDGNTMETARKLKEIFEQINR